MRLLLGPALVGLATYLVLVALLYSQQHRLLFPAGTERTSAAEAGLTGFQDLVLTTADGERLVGWWKPPEPGRALILYFHGNGGSLWNRRLRVQALTAGGRGLLVVSYRGYSGSTGTPSEHGLKLDAEAAYAYLRSYDPKRIVLYGESLGTGVAVRLASEHPVGGVILDAPFTSIIEVAQPIYWFVPVNLLLKHPFKSIDRIARLDAPLLILHGERDGLIPIGLSEILYKAAKEPKRFVRLPEAGHETVLETGGLAHARAFLDEVEAKIPTPAPAP